MSRWNLSNDGNYWTKYYAYENYLRSNASTLGLTDKQVKEQLGRYATGLQQKMQYEPQNRAVGKEVAKDPATWGIKPADISQNLTKAQNKLQTTKVVLSDGATSTTYFGTPEQLRQVEPLGNRAPEVNKNSAKTQTVTGKKQKSKQKGLKQPKGSVVTSKEKALPAASQSAGLSSSSKASGTAANNMPVQSKKVSGVVIADRKAEEIIKFNKLYGKHEPLTWQKYQAEKGLSVQAKKVSGVVEADRKAEEIIKSGKSSSAGSTPKVVPSQAENTVDLNKNLSAVLSENGEAGRSVKLGADPGTKSKTGFLGKIGKIFKGKKGKAAIIGLGIAAVAGACQLLKEDKTEQSPGITTIVPDTPPESTAPVADNNSEHETPVENQNNNDNTEVQEEVITGETVSETPAIVNAPPITPVAPIQDNVVEEVEDNDEEVEEIGEQAETQPVDETSEDRKETVDPAKLKTSIEEINNRIIELKESNKDLRAELKSLKKRRRLERKAQKQRQKLEKTENELEIENTSDANKLSKDEIKALRKEQKEEYKAEKRELKAKIKQQKKVIKQLKKEGRYKIKCIREENKQKVLEYKLSQME